MLQPSQPNKNPCSAANRGCVLEVVVHVGALLAAPSTEDLSCESAAFRNIDIRVCVGPRIRLPPSR
jgi:hypothetical protein